MMSLSRWWTLIPEKFRIKTKTTIVNKTHNNILVLGSETVCLCWCFENLLCLRDFGLLEQEVSLVILILNVV